MESRMRTDAPKKKPDPSARGSCTNRRGEGNRDSSAKGGSRTHEPALGALAKRINSLHEKCAAACKRGVEAAIEIGNLLLLVKSGRELDHGDFQPWIERHCNFSYRTAAAYMRAAKSAATAHLDSESTITSLISGACGGNDFTDAEAPSRFVLLLAVKRIREQIISVAEQWPADSRFALSDTLRELADEVTRIGVAA